MRYTIVILVAVILIFTGTANGKSDYVTSGLACIHHYEGAWNANTGNGYYGGLQMDLNFQARYGYTYLHRTRIYFAKLWGTANNWPVWAQMQAGRNGYRERRWDPWPRTARACGLI